ncbi:hypothetical protein PM082_012325 [Marasmius tenuissimus]|nr:hypothetical protein PM082_012325 [Marasmius tenuissimus]
MVMVSHTLNVQLSLVFALVLLSGGRALATSRTGAAVALVDEGLSRSLTARVLPRQDSGPINISDPSAVPECKDPCSNADDPINSCESTDLKCICTDVNSDALAVCIDCIVNNRPNVVTEAQGQSAMNAFVENCNAGASPVKSQTIRKAGSDNGAAHAFRVGLGVAAATTGALLAAGAALMV